MTATDGSTLARGDVATPVLVSRRGLYFATGLLLVVVTVLYIPGLHGPWVFDDFVNIVEAVPDDDGLGGIARSAFSNTSGLAGRSVSAFTFALNHVLGDGGTFAFKLTNVMLHVATCAASTLLGYALVRRLAPRRSRSEALLLALVTSAIWALHPLHVSTVLYVVQRMSILAMFFSLLALLAWIAARGAIGRRHVAALYASSLAAVVLATLSKETGVLAIGHIVVFELLNPKGLGRRAELQSKALAGCIAVATGVFTLVIAFVPEPIMGGYVLRDFVWTERLLTQAEVMTEYLRQIAFADVERMRFYYDDWPTARSFGPATVVGLTLLVGLVGLAVAARRSAPLVSFGIGMFFVSHLMESSVLPLEHAFEHRNYMGSFGLTMALCAAVLELTRSRRTLLPAVVVALSLAPAYLTAQTTVRVAEWSDNLTLHHEAMQRAPGSFRAAFTLTQIRFWNEGDAERALAVARGSLAIDPSDLSRQLLSSTYETLAGARTSFMSEPLLRAASRDSVRRETTHLLHHITMLSAEGRPGMPSMVDLVALLRRITDNPNQLVTRIERAHMLMDHSDLLIRLDRRDEALERIRKAVALVPADPDALLRLAKREAAVGDYESARDAVTRARASVDWRDPGLMQEIEGTAARIREARERRSTSSATDG